MRKFIILFFFVSYFCFTQTEKRTDFEKNDFRIDLKLPHINHLSLNPDKEFRDNKFGFNGYGIGFEYNYSEKRFVEANISFVLTFELPFPVPVDTEYNRALYSYCLSATDNFIKSHFSFGYGINYAVNHRNEIYEDLGANETPLPKNTYYTNRNLGLTLNTYYNIGKTLNFGIIYRPSLINLDDGFDPIYEHLISLELNWRIKLFNLKK
ncbi:hypothetical protein GSB9_01957 [Flavobacteriaceae bacterium GSB9]|nr:hypothetical protein GSB9_01957 [Flavobacteriaceae bacterium GSB9]